MAAETDLKWNLPGWRIESRYNNNVLIGNWDEERRKVCLCNCYRVHLLSICKFNVSMFSLILILV